MQQPGTAVKQDIPVKLLKNGKWRIFLKQRLGKGSFAQVFRGENVQTGEKVAIKRISIVRIKNEGPILERAILREIEVLRKVSGYGNPYLLKIYDTFLSKNYRYIVMEFCGGGDLQELIEKKGKLPESQALQIAYQMVIGLSALKEMKIVHRDLKPANIFIKGNDFKIGDFGFSHQADSFKSCIGTPIFMAPEFIQGSPYHRAQNKSSAVDIWAFGCIVHQMIFGRHPWSQNARTHEQLIHTIVMGEYKVPEEKAIGGKLGQHTKSMLFQCLTKNPDQRIDIFSLLTHPCFNGCVDSIVAKLSAPVNKSLFNNQGQEENNIYKRELTNVIKDQLNNPNPGGTSGPSDSVDFNPSPAGLNAAEARPGLKPPSMSHKVKISNISPDAVKNSQIGGNRGLQFNQNGANGQTAQYQRPQPTRATGSGEALVREELLNYIDIYNLYYAISLKICNFLTTGLESFFLLKSAYSKSQAIKSIFSSCKKPDPKIMPLNCSDRDWQKFAGSEGSFFKILTKVLETNELLQQELDERHSLLLLSYKSQIISKEIKDAELVRKETANTAVYCIKELVKIYKKNNCSDQFRGCLKLAALLNFVYKVEMFREKFEFYHCTKDYVSKLEFMTDEEIAQSLSLYESIK